MKYGLEVFCTFFCSHSTLLLTLLQAVTTFGFPYTSNYGKVARVIWSLFPPNIFAEALNLLGVATATSEDEGISWSRRGECPNKKSDCVLPIVSFAHRTTGSDCIPIQNYFTETILHR